MRRFNRPGDKYNMLTLERRHIKRRGGYVWICKCDCGDRKVVAVGAADFGESLQQATDHFVKKLGVAA